MNSKGAVSGQHSAVSSDAADPLADARCPQCGYSLRGLPENRCPECGRTFDPAEFTGTFLPRWPQLMAWYLAACIIAQLLEFAPALLRWNGYLLLTLRLGDEPFKNITNITHLVEAAVLCLLGPICIIGLYRRREWARKGCIAIFSLSVLAWLSYLEPIWQYRLWSSGSTGATLPFRTVLARTPEGAPAMLVTFFLLTGLRRQSLRRTGQELAPLLSFKRFRPRPDWPLLTVLILIGLGVSWTCAGWGSLGGMAQYLRAVGVSGRISQHSDLLYVTAKFQIAVGLSTMATAFVMLFCPSWMRLGTGVVLTASLGMRVLELIICWWGYSPSSINASCSVLGMTATVLPHLTLAAFAFLAIGREDIQRLEARG